MCVCRLGANRGARGRRGPEVLLSRRGAAAGPRAPSESPAPSSQADGLRAATAGRAAPEHKKRAPMLPNALRGGAPALATGTTQCCSFFARFVNYAFMALEGVGFV